ncbi:hypothetical protein Z948_364 [Sulfitobacter donghicola DSW-25 = KCTC 12864 = JCM 14565]|nr:hypothetical protein Z948_364 [Sulfitobacter donghicola DSW-25 = KCTC 12864 = JCM 14565]
MSSRKFSNSDRFLLMGVGAGTEFVQIQYRFGIGVSQQGP